jgi:catechol 2,3-dioxygenase-like lactoylglutathione lyase family enzyme
VLHHVSLEVPEADVEASVGFWGLVGFEHVPEPEPLRGFVTWVQHGANQVHLIHTDSALVPTLGHAAVVVDDFEATLASLEEAGHQVERAQELWGKPRAFAIAPGGHRVELMAAPPT